MSELRSIEGTLANDILSVCTTFGALMSARPMHPDSEPRRGTALIKTLFPGDYVSLADALAASIPAGRHELGFTQPDKRLRLAEQARQYKLSVERNSWAAALECEYRASGAASLLLEVPLNLRLLVTEALGWLDLIHQDSEVIRNACQGPGIQIGLANFQILRAGRVGFVLSVPLDGGAGPKGYLTKFLAP